MYQFLPRNPRNLPLRQKKAFDSIKHDKLWDALERKGISGHFLMYGSLYIVS